MKQHEIIALGDLEVDLGARRVTRNGQELELARLSFDLLEALIHASPAALSNDEIVARVWSGDAVTDENIKQRVSLLRRALRQGSDRKYVETLRGFGYRLAETPRASAPRGETPDTESPPPRPDRLARRLLLILAIVSLVLLVTVLAIAARQLKRMKISVQPAAHGSSLAAGSPSRLEAP